MKALLQRVSEAAVTVRGGTLASIPRGLFVLIAVAADDSPQDAHRLAHKILSIRLFDHPDTAKPWSQSVTDINGHLLCVSQFTLHALTHKSPTPDFHRAMNAAAAKVLYDLVLTCLAEKLPSNVKHGLFGEYMQCSLTNDGPVTVEIDTKRT
ncbi:D-tyrosyl-tRNA(Tyr) deacylase [Neolecta irregularis DAH-3]|uniref:D-aminoacyl-tRNA deacylase n=1 Tax=Neolecta irregularis (strain DAH-3) TaxID=1198029 RepID=A0A1U7LMI2_NEOID|nr:D-tyrosyl-tRNA(Tyr) deacylase [Neolecta irregularis DAH-3]|eukprot:OLL23849.1 D-tyrosyl-tRNA(Tyr) deacylase [Neolecta irregularis DAH-3]